MADDDEKTHVQPDPPFVTTRGPLLCLLNTRGEQSLRYDDVRRVDLEDNCVTIYTFQPRFITFQWPLLEHARTAYDTFQRALAHLWLTEGGRHPIASNTNTRITRSQRRR